MTEVSDEEDEALAAAQRALLAAKDKQAEAAKRAQLLTNQALELGTRAQQLSQGEAALRQRQRQRNLAVQLPASALHSFGAASSAAETTGSLTMHSAGTNVQDQAQRDADYDMAKRKQQAAEKRVKQQMEAQALNKQRLELQRKTEELDAERIPMRRNHAASNADAAERALAAVRVAIEAERQTAAARIDAERDEEVRQRLEAAEAEAEARRVTEEAAADDALANAVAEKERTAAAATRLEARLARDAVRDAKEARREERARSRERVRSRERARSKERALRRSVSRSEGEEVSEAEELKYASDYTSGPASPMRQAEPVSTAEDDDDDEIDDDASGGEEESEEEDEEEESEASEDIPEAAKPIETAKAVRERYVKSLSEQEAAVKARERAVKESRQQLEKEDGGRWYNGELGSQTYRPHQLDSYIVARSLAAELVDQVLDQIDEHRRAVPTIPMLEEEYANWQDSHEMLKKRLEQRAEEERLKREGSGDDDEVDDEFDDYDWGGPSSPDANNDGEGRRFTFRGIKTIDENTQWELLSAVLNDLVYAEVDAVARQALGERELATKLTRRLLFGSIARAATGTRKVPTDELSTQLQSMYSDMTRRRSQIPDAQHKHTSHLAIKWRGKRPKRPKRVDQESSSSSDDEDDAEAEAAGGATPLSLDEASDVPGSAYMRRLYVQAEGEYWGATRTDGVFVNADLELGAGCAQLSFSPNAERSLLACGTVAGGLGVWHLDVGPTCTLLRKGLSRAAPPNGVLALKWSHDGTELVATDDAGSTRIWSVSGHVSALTSLASQRASAFSWQSAKLQADDAIQQAVAAADADAESAARARYAEASDKLAEEAAREQQVMQGVMSKPLGGQGVGGGLSSVPHLLLDVTYLHLYHAELLDSTDEAENALAGRKAGASSYPGGAPPMVKGQQASVRTLVTTAPKDEEKGLSKREQKAALKERDAAGKASAEAANKSPSPKKGGFFGGGKKKEAEPVVAAAPDPKGTKAAVDVPPPKPGREWEDLYPLLGEFHPSFTLLGTQPSILVAMKGGLIAKVNRPGAERVMHLPPLLSPMPLATKEETDAALTVLRKANAAKDGAAPARADKKADKKAKAGKGGAISSAAIDSTLVTREYFTGHSAPVVMIGFVRNSSDMISLDESGLMLEWPYRAEHYVSYGWYIPARSTKLSLALRMSCRVPDGDETLFPTDEHLRSAPVAEPRGRSRSRSKAKEPQADPIGTRGAYTTTFARASKRWDQEKVDALKLPEQPWRISRLDDGRLVRLYGEPSTDAAASEVTSLTRDADGVLLRHATCQYEHRRVHAKLACACLNPSATELCVLLRFDDVPEGAQLRLQTMPIGSDEPRKWRPLKMTFPINDSSMPTRLVVGPYLDVPSSEYAFVLADNIVRMCSLGSGVVVRTISPLRPYMEELPLQKDPLPLLSSLAISSSGKCLAVGTSEAHPEHKASGFWVYDLTPPQQPHLARHALVGVRAGSARYNKVMPEQRVREGTFYLGTDRAGALNDHAHVQDFMERTAREIIDDALRTLDPPDVSSAAEGDAPAPTKLEDVQVSEQQQKSPKGRRKR